MSEAEEEKDQNPEPSATEPLKVEGDALRGLAHPLRARILDELDAHGPATATILGKRLGESSGSTSYHLRQLSRFGFVEADPGRSGGRDRWWRTRLGGWHMSGHEMLRSPATREAAEIVLGRYYTKRMERLERWRTLAREHPEDPRVRRWKKAMQDSVGHMRMTPEETEEFARALYAFIREWGAPFRDRTAEEHPDTESVELQTELFPNLPEPGDDPADPADPVDPGENAEPVENTDASEGGDPAR